MNTMVRPLRVCITASMLPSCGRGAFNGCVQHTLFMGRWFQRVLQADVGYVIPEKWMKNAPATPEELKIARGTFFSNREQMLQYDFVLAIGQHVGAAMKEKLKSKGIPVVIMRLGNDLVYDTTHIMGAAKFSHKDAPPIHMGSILQGTGYDECWISPHFAYAIDYYSYISNHPLGSTRVVPYFWDPVFIDRQMKTRGKDLLPLAPGNVRVAVFESNQTMNKSMFMPLAVLHYADPYFKKAYIMCCATLKKPSHPMFKTFLSYCRNCDGVASGKVTFEGRIPMTQVMTGHANVVLSWQRDWSLNYLPLECMWLGIPVIHNCAEMKQFGFYYHENDLAGAVAHLKRLNEEPFDREAYRKRNARVMQIYGPDKPELLAFMLDRVKSLVKTTWTSGNEKKRVPASVVDYSGETMGGHPAIHPVRVKFQVPIQQSAPTAAALAFM